MKIFSGRSNVPLAEKIADHLGTELGKVNSRQFSDGELWVKYEENIRGQDVFIIQSTHHPADNIIELVLMIDAAVRASARRVTAVIPYYGYGRQDRKESTKSAYFGPRHDRLNQQCGRGSYTGHGSSLVSDSGFYTHTVRSSLCAAGHF